MGPSVRCLLQVCVLYIACLVGAAGFGIFDACDLGGGGEDDASGGDGADVCGAGERLDAVLNMNTIKGFSVFIFG